MQLVLNGIAYIPYYEPAKIIAGFDLKTGERAVVATIPDMIDDYHVSEIEGIIYDFETELFVVVDAFGLISSKNFYDGYTFVAEIPFRWAMSACYTEDGKYVVAYTSSDGNCLILRCYDAKNNIVVWSKEINEVKYANTICFRKKDRCLYVAECYTYADAEHVGNRICVLDYDNIDRGFVKVIKSPARGGIYSIGYDECNDIFYSTNYLGDNEGKANALFSYNGIFESVRKEIFLDDLTVRNSPSYQSMGIQCVVENTAYILYSSPEFVIAGFDSVSGNMKFAYSIPKMTTDNKAVIRPESILYNPDLDVTLIQTATAMVCFGESKQ